MCEDEFDFRFPIMDSCEQLKVGVLNECIECIEK